MGHGGSEFPITPYLPRSHSRLHPHDLDRGVASRFIRFLLEEDIYDRFHFNRGSSYAISTLLHYVILLAGFFVAIAALGADMTKFTVLAGALGVGIGFGLQNHSEQFRLRLDPPLRAAGESRRCGAGAVGHRSDPSDWDSRRIIRLFDSSELIVPNGQLISDKVTNWTLSNRQRRIELRVGVAYGSDPKRVIALLTEVAGAHPLALKYPAPQTLLTEFGTDLAQFRSSTLDRRLRSMAADQKRRRPLRSPTPWRNSKIAIRSRNAISICKASIPRWRNIYAQTARQFRARH